MPVATTITIENGNVPPQNLKRKDTGSIVLEKLQSAKAIYDQNHSLKTTAYSALQEGHFRSATASKNEEDAKSSSYISDLIIRNRKWSKTMIENDALYFQRLVSQQKPKLLWIGCSDSRVPANQIINLPPGQVFVHRNIANIAIHSDNNMLSVLKYAVDVLRVEQIAIVGHYGCGGVIAATTNQQYGYIDMWLKELKDLYENNRNVLEALPDDSMKADLLCELNVCNSALNVCKTTIVQNAWNRGQALEVHGWCYRLADGILRDLDIHIKGSDQIDKIFKIMRKEPPIALPIAMSPQASPKPDFESLPVYRKKDEMPLVKPSSEVCCCLQ